MDARARLTFLFGCVAAIVGSFAVAHYTHWVVAFVFLIFVFSSAGAFIWIEDTTRRPALQAMFEAQSTGTLYRRLIRRPAHWPRDWRMHDWALRLAMVYPVAAALCTWAGGYPVEIGKRELIAVEPEIQTRIAVICGIAVMVFLLSFSLIIGEAARKWFLRKFVGRLNVERWESRVRLLAGAIAIAIAFAFAFAGAGAAASVLAFVLVGAFAFAFAVAVSGAGASTVAGAVAFVFAIAIAIAFAFSGAFPGALAFVALAVGVAGGIAVGAIAIELHDKIAIYRLPFSQRLPDLFYLLLMLALVLALTIVLVLTNWETTRPAAGRYVLFLGLLPLLNASFDYLSYLVTFTLLRRGYERPRLAPWLGALDLGVAFVLFALSGAGIVLAIVAVNHFTNTPLYPLQPLFDGIRANPGAYWWVYLMLFSTLLPTLLHFAAAAFAVGVWLPISWRTWVSRSISDEAAVPGTFVPLAIGAWTTVSVIVPSLLVAGMLYMLSQVFSPHPFAWYLDMLQNLAQSANVVLRP